jgi:hypothetical protein
MSAEHVSDHAPGMLVGGPVKRPWREGTLTRAAELAALTAWMLQKHKGDGEGRRAEDSVVLVEAIGNHLKAARDAAEAKRYYRNGSRLERAISNLDAAEADLLNLASNEHLLGEMPSLLNHVQRHLRPSDPRRKEVERIAQRVGVKDPEHPLTGPEKTLDEKRNEIAKERGALVSAVRGASSAALREQSQVRNFRNVVIGVTGVMAAAVIALGVMAWRSPSIIPLCFAPNATPAQTIVVCPTGQSEPLAAQPESTTPTKDIDDSVNETVAPYDMLLIEVIGASAASVAAAVALRRLRGSSEPYGVPVALGALKLPTGALTAVLGLLLMRGEFVPGLSALDSSAQIIAWAIVFGYAQQLFTRLVDQQAHTVLDGVRGGPASPSSAEASRR